MFTISYYKTEDTKVMVVTLHAIKQTIILQPGFFYKITGVDRKVISGCNDFNGTILVDLGFVFPFKSDRKIG